MTPKDRAKLRQMFGGHCAYCGEMLPEKGWHADHVEPIFRKLKYERNYDTGRTRIVQTGECYHPERDTKENLFPSCAKCNNYKGGQGLEGFRGALARQIEMLRAYSANFRTAERFGLVEAKEMPIVFYFEKYADSAPDTTPSAIQQLTPRFCDLQ